MPDKRSYQPGHRRKDLKGQPTERNAGEYSETRYAWCRTDQGQIVILVTPEKDPGETGEDVTLYFPGKRIPMALVLTALTEEELNAAEDIIASAFEWARPIVQVRDKEAEDARREGDDSKRRSYRPVPQLVYRKRPLGQHGSSLLNGPEDVPASGWGGLDIPGRVRGDGPELAEHDPPEGQAEDDSTPAD